MAQQKAEAAEKSEIKRRSRRLARAAAVGNTAQPKRSKAEEVETALMRGLEGENVTGILEKFNQKETDLFYALLEEARGSQTLDLDLLWAVDYVQPPPTMREFIEDEYWLGNVLRSVENEQTGLFPVWKDALIRDFDLDSRVNNAVVTGSLGIGKSYVCAVILLYRLTLARLLRNPQNFFGLGKGSQIYYIILSITQTQVKETTFGDVLNFMSASPFFLEECRFNPNNKYTNHRVPVGRSIFITAGSRGQHVLGRNPVAILLDEGNFRLEANPDQKAYDLYNDVRNRIKNRFQKLSTFLPAISILASSAADESSFTETVIADIKKVNDPKTQLVYRFAVYRVRPDRRYSGVCFRVAYGIKNVDPIVLSGFCKEDGTPLPGVYDYTAQLTAEHIDFERAPQGASVEIVPVELLEEFKRNCKAALRDQSGISTGGTNRFFADIVDIEKACEAGEKSGVRDPIKIQGLTEIPLSNEDGLQIWDFLTHRFFVTMRASSYLPLRHPDAPRYAHLDLATQSLAGLAICHPVGATKVEGVWDTNTGRVFDEYRVNVEYDFILTLCSGKSKPISFEKIQNFFIWLRNYCGFQFAQISADTFQSEGPLQALDKNGFKTDIISLVRTKVPYLTFRTAFEDGRIRMYRQEQFMREAEKLLDLPDLVDHPPGGSKDTADAMAGAYYALHMDTENGNIQINKDPTIYSSGEASIMPGHEAPLISFEIKPEKPHETMVYDA